MIFYFQLNICNRADDPIQMEVEDGLERRPALQPALTTERVADMEMESGHP